MSTKKTSTALVPGFAAAVRAARERRGWNQRELAEAAGLSQVTVSELEREMKSPTLASACRIAAALELPGTLIDPVGHGQAAEKNYAK